MADIPSFLRGTLFSRNNKTPLEDDPSSSMRTQIATKSPAKNPEQRSSREKPLSDPSIRTMQSDIEQLFKTSPPSIAQMVARPDGMTRAAKKNRNFASIYIVAGFVIVCVAILGYVAYYYQHIFFPPSSDTQIRKAVPPTPLFATESSRALDVWQDNREQFNKLMRNEMQEYERDGTIKRILIKFSNTQDQRYADIADLFDQFGIVPPQNLLKRFQSASQMFIYTSTGTRFGFAVRTSDPTRTIRDMLDWERTMLLDIKPLFFGQSVNPVTATFQDRTYRNIDWRYFKLSDTIDIGIGYAIFPAGNILILTTSKASMETVINRLFDAR